MKKVLVALFIVVSVWGCSKSESDISAQNKINTQPQESSKEAAVSSKQNNQLAASAIKGTESSPIDLSTFKEFTLPAAFVAAYEKELHAFYAKDQYESTSDYKLRTKDGPKLSLLSNKYFYHFIIQDVESKYDADKSVFIIKGNKSSSFDGMLVKELALDENYKPSKFEDSFIRIASISNEKSVVNGQNSYGAGAQVERIEGSDLYFKVKNKNFKNVTKHHGVNAMAKKLFRGESVYLNAVAEHLSEARDCEKQVVVTAHLDRPASKFTEFLQSKISEATIEHPLSANVSGKDIPMVLDHMYLKCAQSGVVVGTFDYSQKSNDVIVE